MPAKCPYCQVRPIKRSTCGEPECQIAHHRKMMKILWGSRGKIYNQRKKVKEYREFVGEIFAGK
jgi:hypothetical protein